MSVKSQIINSVLENSVYQSDSGMRDRLAKNLEKLSGQDVAALKLIVEIKVSDARKEAARECGKFSKLLHGGAS